MPKTGLDEKWRECDRCGFRQKLSNLRYDEKRGLWLCVVQVYCFDDKNFYDYDQAQQSHIGFIFEP